MQCGVSDIFKISIYNVHTQKFDKIKMHFGSHRFINSIESISKQFDCLEFRFKFKVIL